MVVLVLAEKRGRSLDADSGALSVWRDRPNVPALFDLRRVRSRSAKWPLLLVWGGSAGESCSDDHWARTNEVVLPPESGDVGDDGVVPPQVSDDCCKRYALSRVDEVVAAGSRGSRWGRFLRLRAVSGATSRPPPRGGREQDIVKDEAEPEATRPVRVFVRVTCTAVGGSGSERDDRDDRLVCVDDDEDDTVADAFPIAKVGDGGGGSTMTMEARFMTVVVKSAVVGDVGLARTMIVLDSAVASLRSGRLPVGTGAAGGDTDTA